MSIITRMMALFAIVAFGSHGHVMADPSADITKRAWVGILVGNSYNNTQLLATQIESVKRYSQIEHVTLALPSVDEDTRSFVENLGTSIVNVPRILPRYDISQDWFQDIFVRLHLWAMTDYDQVVYLDSDAFLMNADADNVFDLCQEDFCAVERTNTFDGDDEAQLLNAGMLVVRPGISKFDYLVNEALPQHSYHPYPDEAFLSEVFLSNIHGQKMGSVKLLPWKNNTCSYAFFKEMGKCKQENEVQEEEGSTVDYVDCLRPLVGRCLHFPPLWGRQAFETRPLSLV